MRQYNSVQPPPADAGGARKGSQPSLAECVAGLEDLWRMHRDEAALKTALVVALTCDTPQNELAPLQHLFRGQPNLDPAELNAILDRVPPPAK